MTTNTNRNNDLIWNQRIQACSASNLSINRWCRENSVKASAYHYWLKKLGHQSASMETEWAEVKLKHSTISDSLQPIKLHFHDFTIEIPPEFNKESLAEVLSALRSVC